MKLITAFAIALCLNATAQDTQKPKLRPPTAPSVPEPAPSATAPAATAPASEPETPEKTVARFFASIQRKEVDQAYEVLTKGTKIAERAEDVKMLKSKTKDAIAVFGAIGGYDLAATKKVGERLVSYTYVSLGKEFPLRWRFYFYKPADTWKLIDLRVDDRLAAIFDEQEERRPEQ
jgi:hypothetical protein